MNRDFLKELELEGEVIDKIMKEHGKAVNGIKEKADKVDGLESQIEDYKGQLKERDDQLEELSDKAKGNEELEGTIQELKDANEETKNNYESKLADQQKKFAIQNKLRDDKARDPEILLNILDLDSIQLKDGELIGFKEQIDPIKENKSYLFGEGDKVAGRDPHPSDPNKQPQKVTKDQFNQMGYSERVQLYNDNPDLYKKLNS